MKNIRKNIFILISLLMLVIAIYLIYPTITNSNKPYNIENEPNVKTVENEPNVKEEDLNISIKNLETVFYKSEILDFDFYTVKLLISSNKDIVIDNSNFRSSEGIILSGVNSYLEELSRNDISIKEDINVGKINITENGTEVYIFIPTYEDEVDIVFEYNNEDNDNTKVIKIDSYNAVVGHIKIPPKYEYEPINVGDDYIFKVISIRDLTNEDVYYVNEDDERFSTRFPSNISVIGVYIDIELIAQKIIIDEALLVVNDKEYKLLKKEYDFDEINELNEKEITENMKGYLVFEITEQGLDIANEKAILKIKLANKDKYVEVPIN